MRKNRAALGIASVCVALCMGVSLAACTVVEDEEHVHTWDAGVTTATCTEDGTTTYTCTECGATETMPATATGHSYKAESTTATCTEKGKITYTCSKCGDKQEEETEALGHSYAVTSTTATCEAGGMITYTCSRCGDIQEETTDALGHSYEVTSTSATCTTSGVITYTCSRCDDSYTEETAALGHSYEVTSTSATCTTSGVITYTCSRCDATKTETVEEPLGHEWEEDVDSETASCTEAGTVVYKCSRCNETYTGTVTEPLGHDWEEIITREPTCTVKGIVHYRCTRCGLETNDEFGSENQSPRIEMLGHNYETTYTDPTCSDAGYYTSVCSRCGNIEIEEDTDAPALGHEWVETSTSTDDGITTTVYTCSRCDGTYTEKTGSDGTTVSEWDGDTKDTTSWLETEGEEEYTYEIATAAQFAGLAAYVNAGHDLSGYTIELTSNINLSGYNWTPIGNNDLQNSEANPFSGIFDGNGHTIYNLSINSSSGDCVGLFGYIYTATIKDVNVYNASITGREAIGTIVGEADNAVEINTIYSTVSGCSVTGSVKIDGNGFQGGIIGEANKTVIESCSVNADSGSYITATYLQSDIDGGQVGGIAGCIMTDVSSSANSYTKYSHVYDVTVSGLSISGRYDVGGIVGAILDYNITTNYVISSADATQEGSGNSISNCTISVTYDNKEAYVGAIIGVSLYGVTVEHVSISGVEVQYYKSGNVNAESGTNACIR